MAGRCEHCRAQLLDGARFCVECGQEVVAKEKVKNFCTNCGKELSSTAQFCRHCGAVARGSGTQPVAVQQQIPLTQSPVVQLPGSSNKKKKGPRPVTGEGAGRKRKTFRSLAVLALLLMGISLMARLSWPEKPPYIPSVTTPEPSPGTGETPLGITNFTDVIITAADFNVPGERATVSPEDPVATVKGIKINFSSHNLSEEKTLTVKKLALKTDEVNGYTIQAYDFHLEDMDQFLTPVVLEIPYEPLVENAVWEANNIFLQYFNKNSGQWQIMPSWVNTEKNIITTLTDHFSPYAVFQDIKVEDPGSTVALFSYLGNKYQGPATPVVTTGLEIERHLSYVDESLYEKFIDTKSVPVMDSVSTSLNVLNHEVSATNYALFATSDALYEAYSPTLSLMGMTLVLSKMANQWYNNVPPDQIILSNALSLTEIALGTAASSLTPAQLTALSLTAPELTAAAAAVWAVGFAYDAGSATIDYWQETETRYAGYKKFSESNNIVFLEDLGEFVYIKECTDPGYSGYDASYANSRRIHMYGDQHAWAQVFSAINRKHKNNPPKITAALELALESYLDVFWQVDGNEVLEFFKTVEAPGYLDRWIVGATIADLWEWPTTAEEQSLKDAYREKMKEFLQPVMKGFSLKSMGQLRQMTLDAVIAAWPKLNEILYFEIVDENLAAGEYFPSSPFAKHHIAFESLDPKAVSEDWVCAERNERNNNVFTCNLYGLIKVGSPDKLVFYEKETGTNNLIPQLATEFEVAVPTTVIRVNSKADIESGIYLGGAGAKNLLGSSWSKLVYPAIRLEKRADGLLIGPCLEDGTYDNSWQVLCNKKPDDVYYLGEKQIESDSHRMSLTVNAVYDEKENTLTVRIVQNLFLKPNQQYPMGLPIEINYSYTGRRKGALTEKDNSPVDTFRTLNEGMPDNL